MRAELNDDDDWADELSPMDVINAYTNQHRKEPDSVFITPDTFDHEIPGFRDDLSEEEERKLNRWVLDEFLYSDGLGNRYADDDIPGLN